jgi:predicted nucleic acid-binding protein
LGKLHTLREDIESLPVEAVVPGPCAPEETGIDRGTQLLFAGRVLPFDEKAALVWARLMAEGTARGRPRSPLDMIVAAVAEANDCVVVTENERDFAGLKIVNP